MTVKLLTINNLEFLSLKEGCTGSSVSTLAKKPHCWKITGCGSYITTKSGGIMRILFWSFIEDEKYLFMWRSVVLTTILKGLLCELMGACAFIRLNKVYSNLFNKTRTY